MYQASDNRHDNCKYVYDEGIIFPSAFKHEERCGKLHMDAHIPLPFASSSLRTIFLNA